MTRITNLVLKLKIWKDQHGQDLIEYALMAGFVAVAAGAIMPNVATSISTIFSRSTARWRRQHAELTNPLCLWGGEVGNPGSTVPQQRPPYYTSLSSRSTVPQAFLPISYYPVRIC